MNDIYDKTIKELQENGLCPSGTSKLGRFDLTGRQVGELLVLAPAPPEAGGRTTWLCRCSCGNYTIVKTKSLNNEGVKSCGCRKYIFRHSRLSHGLSRTRLDRIWGLINQRCNNPKSPRYKDYGGRGIINMFTCLEDFAHWASIIKRV